MLVVIYVVCGLTSTLIIDSRLRQTIKHIDNILRKGVRKMDFSAWSPSHTLLLVIMLLAFGGQLVATLTYLKTTANQHNQKDKRNCLVH